MKTLAAVALIVLLGTGLASADDVVTWEGYQWDTQGFGSLSVSSLGLQLQITSVATDPYTWGPWSWGVAHTQIAGFAAYPSPWLQTTFIDDVSSGTGPLLAFENPLDPNPVWGEVGFDPGISTTNYGVWVYNELTNEHELVVLAQRTSGEHTVDIGRSATGTLDFYLDNQLRFTSTIGTPNSLSDIWLFANGSTADAGGTATFTSFSAGNGYVRNVDGTFDPQVTEVSSVPEPTALVLMGTGLSFLGALVRRRRRNARALPS